MNNQNQPTGLLFSHLAFKNCTEKGLLDLTDLVQKKSTTENTSSGIFVNKTQGLFGESKSKTSSNGSTTAGKIGQQLDPFLFKNLFSNLSELPGPVQNKINDNTTNFQMTQQQITSMFQNNHKNKGKKSSKKQSSPFYHESFNQESIFGNNQHNNQSVSTSNPFPLLFPTVTDAPQNQSQILFNNSNWNNQTSPENQQIQFHQNEQNEQNRQIMNQPQQYYNEEQMLQIYLNSLNPEQQQEYIRKIWWQNHINTIANFMQTNQLSDNPILIQILAQMTIEHNTNQACELIYYNFQEMTQMAEQIYLQNQNNGYIQNENNTNNSQHYEDVAFRQSLFDF